MKSLLLFLFAAALANPIAQNNEPIELSEDTLESMLETTEFRLSDGMNRFSNRLFSSLSSSSNGGNVVCSPFSIHAALAMLYFAAPEESKTNAELTDLLGLEKEHLTAFPVNYLQMFQRYDEVGNQSGAKISVANKIFANKGFGAKVDYLTLLRYFFRTSVGELDFGDTERSVDIINNYVAAKTNGKIRDLVDDSVISSLTRMMLINAVYFKADWKFKFDEFDTKPKEFEVEPGLSYTYNDTMHIEANFGVADMTDLGAQVLELPYANEDFRLLVILPNDPADLNQVQDNLVDFDFSELDIKFQYGPTKVQLPKFKLKGKSSLKSHLQSLGVTTLFNPDLIDLSDMSDKEDVYVSSVEHVAEVEVNEEGSEAAAATSITIETRASGPKPKETSFIANRPFIFIIQDRFLNVPLFQGRIVDPEGERKMSQVANLEALESYVENFEVREDSLDGDEEDEDEEDCPEDGFEGVDQPNVSFPCKKKKDQDTSKD